MRIESAIKDQNLDELKWALDYSKMMLQLSSMKEHQKQWKQYIAKINHVIERE